jgi:hypothetical protein
MIVVPVSISWWKPRLSILIAMSWFIAISVGLISFRVSFERMLILRCIVFCTPYILSGLELRSCVINLCVNMLIEFSYICFCNVFTAWLILFFTLWWSYSWVKTVGHQNTVWFILFLFIGVLLLINHHKKKLFCCSKSYFLTSVMVSMLSLLPSWSEVLPLNNLCTWYTTIK